MPYQRPTLSGLRAQVAADIHAGLPGSDALLRFSSLKIFGDALAGLAQQQYGYTDWVAMQSNPFTATDEFLEAWAALKRVFREAATSAGRITPGQVSFRGGARIVVPAGTALVRGDGVTYRTTSDASVADGNVTVSAVADPDPSGMTGAFGNCPAGTVMSLGASIAGIQSSGVVQTAFSGGADAEDDESLRSRMLHAYQNPVQGGAAPDYVTWSLEVGGISRAWCRPLGFGAGTVVVYIMRDKAGRGSEGFPVGADGCATQETRGKTATGDQLAVANYIFTRRAATALVYVVSPIRVPVHFVIGGIGGASAATRAAISAAISAVFTINGTPLGANGKNGLINLSDIESAIAAIPGTRGFVIKSPTGNIAGSLGQLPVLGSVSYT